MYKMATAGVPSGTILTSFTEMYFTDVVSALAI
jgi:hypothetical protein